MSCARRKKVRKSLTIMMKTSIILGHMQVQTVKELKMSTILFQHIIFHLKSVKTFEFC